MGSLDDKKFKTTEFYDEKAARDQLNPSPEFNRWKIRKQELHEATKSLN